MDFRALLEEGHSKEITNTIVSEIGNSSKKMEQLMSIFIKGPQRISQRAAWPMSHIVQNHPNLLDNYYTLFIQLLHQNDNHNAINRNILRALQFVDIPEQFQGEILDVSFKLLNSSEEPIAVKVFSMTVIFNLSKKYPEIIPELKSSINMLMPTAKPGIKSRGNRILNQLKAS